MGVLLNGAGMLPDAGDVYAVGSVDLELVEFAGETLLYATTRAGGGITTYRLTQGGAQIVDRDRIAQDRLQLIAPELAWLPAEQGGQLMVAGLGGSQLTGWTLAGNGGLSNSRDHTVNGLSLNRVTDMVTLAQSDGSVLAYAAYLGRGLQMFEFEADGGLHRHRDQGEAGPGAGHRVSDLLVTRAGGTDFVLATHATADAITLYRVKGDGSLQHVNDHGAEGGLWIDAPTDAEALTLYGQTYVIVAAAGSGTLSVVRLDADGTLTPVDHVIDDRLTRFDGVAEIATVSAGGRGFVLAGGGDDGLSLLELLPGGQLLHHVSIADRLDLSLANVTRIEARIIGDNLEVFALSETERGVTRLSFDLGRVGDVRLGADGADILSGGGKDDVLDGGAGDDTLSGGGGDDVLIAGAGFDHLTGGSGADVFVLTPGEETVTIQDFEVGRDRLDLTRLTPRATLQELVFSSTDRGGILLVAGKQIDLISATGDPLRMDDFPADALIQITRAPVESYVASDPLVYFSGDAGDDRVIGDTGADTIQGMGGDDTLAGGAGDDRILGEDGADELHGGADADLVMGGGGNDTLRGNAGADLLYGGNDHDGLEGNSGDDQLHGDRGDDRLHGGLGRDHLNGGSGADVLNGDGDNDALHGGWGADTLIGGPGEDALFGGGDGDLLRGEAGHDTLHGEGGDDRLEGAENSDRLYGGEGRDTLIGGDGQDELYGDGGNDALTGGTGNDRLTGGTGQDTLSGGTQEDRLYGGAGGDHLMGEGGFDRLEGGSGDDLLDGGNQADNLFGGQGEDRLLGGGGFDRLFGGAQGDDLVGGAWHDALFGEWGDDTLDGGSGDDRLWAGGDNDHLLGNSGNDQLHGGAGFDTLEGGAGDDVLWGDFNADTFVFADHGGDDRLIDFDALNPHERIDLREVSAIRDFADLLAQHLEPLAGGVLIDFGGTGSVFLDAVGIADLDAGDFVL
ncbi:calcium-binding protein [Pseudooceanicola aestuarii]|uniref:calcium-binding protein n=1 Tax=Pseudooceanicola aestuarii TaxID=2697319 RepID=UPI0013D2DE60|nr:calcium-binding protein [Pseudooceanicola aestuarii]